MIPFNRLRIVLAVSEAVPWFKTGGLADVTTALARALDKQGHDVTIILPDYAAVRGSRSSLLPEVTNTGIRFSVNMVGETVEGAVRWAKLPESRVKVLLLAQGRYFNRPQLYMEDGVGYEDNCERFCFFSRAVLEICSQMVLRPDILHCNDWQTALIPALLHSQFADRPGFENAASVMTIHNMSFQGQFWHLDMPLTSMDWQYFSMHHMEHHGDLNLLKTGIAMADQVTTVSPTYAKEICTPEGGCGLDGLLRHRRSDLTGILNGIDQTIWNPNTDRHLSAHFSAGKPQPGKSVCKEHIQQRMNLPVRSDVPLFGMVSRISDQKGFDLIVEASDRILSQDLQFVILGTGDLRYEDQLRRLAERFRSRVAVVIGFDDSLAHQIEAGSDVFLMPSRFEPCGLNQMYSQRYGTVPVVRRVGGLADSVTDTDEETLADRSATGFVFGEYCSVRLAETIERALTTFRQPAVWKQIVHAGMSSDWSWSRSAKRYVEVYHQALERRHERDKDGRQ
ncbi:MAG: glycogen synthase GlgA [Fuerstiella sp.]|nr:glycogen synthase GlgA [Fuerstiella sp.]